jgi:hypothetical protein
VIKHASRPPRGPVQIRTNADNGYCVLDTNTIEPSGKPLYANRASFFNETALSQA